jgi:hypothetical protein
MRCLHTMAQFARGIPMEESKYRDEPLHRYSDDEMAKIVDQHEREYLRGSEILYWEDVGIGAELPPIVKGPHTPSDYVMYHSAFGAFFDVTDRIKYLMLKRIPGTGIVDPATNVPDFSASWHLGTYTGSSVGFPRGFDGSMQRISWFGHLVTNWMGDDAFLKSLSIYHCRPLFLWDAMWLHGRVVGKDRATSTVDLELWGDNHRGERISNGKATVVLQNHFGRPFEYS